MWVSAVYRTSLSHKWTEIFTKIAYFLLLESSRTKFQKPFVCKSLISMFCHLEATKCEWAAVYRTTLSHKWTEIFTKIAYFLLLESSRTKFQKPFVCKVWFLCSVIWRPQKCEWAPFTALLYLISGPRYSQKSHIFFCWKVAERNFRNPLFAKFDFYVLSSGGHKMWVSAVYRTTLSHKWTEIFTKIAYFLLLESSRTKFQKPFVSKVWFLCSVIWRPQKVSERRLPHYSIS